MTDLASARDLAACPLCGGTETSHGFVSGGGVQWGTAGCEACDLQVTKRSESEAITAWNRRVAATAPRDDGEKVAHENAGKSKADEFQWVAAGSYREMSVGSDDARAILAALSRPAAVPEGWIGWSGGAVPVRGTDARGLIMFNIDTLEQAEARGEHVLDYWPWFGEDERPCVVAYKLSAAPPAEQVAEHLAADREAQIRREAYERAARQIELAPAEILHFWDRPGGPPGNGYRPTTRVELAAMVRALARNGGGERGAGEAS